MKATIFIHIGMHKTGTTSIQATFFKNRRKLREHGINYLSINENHSETLYPLFCGAPHLYHINKSLGIDTPEKAARRNKSVAKSLDRELERNTCSRFIISGEDLLRLMPDEIEQLKLRLEPFAEKYRIIAYVRDPYAFVNSAFQQRLRAGATYEELLEKPPRPMYRRIHRYIRVFGRENVDIRIFDPSRFIAGDLIADFLSAVDAEPTLSNQLDVVRSNVALSLEAALILNEINKRFPRRADAPPNPERAGDLIELLAKIPGQPFRCPRAVFDVVDPLLADDLQWLHRVLGTPVFAARPEWKEPSPNWSADTLLSIGTLINELAVAVKTRRQQRRVTRILDTIASSVRRSNASSPAPG